VLTQEIVPAKKKSDSGDAGTVVRLTALWVISETLLGGVLHLFRVPFTGLLVGCAAVVLMILLARFQRRRAAFSRVLLVVMTAKMMLLPGAPVNAYLALSLQGLLALLLLYPGAWFTGRAVLFGGCALLLGALQKVLVLTLIYGQTLWEAVDIYAAQLYQWLGGSGELPAARLLITAYVVLHGAAGIWAGWWAAGLPSKLRDFPPPAVAAVSEGTGLVRRGASRSWWRRPGVLAVWIFSLALYLLAWFNPLLWERLGWKPLLLVVRTVFVLTLWFKILGPRLVGWLHRMLQNSRRDLQIYLDRVLLLLPEMQQLVRGSWHAARGSRFPHRWFRFLNFLAAGVPWGAVQETPDGEESGEPLPG